MKYDIERAAVTLSVGELCAYACTEGDLDLRHGSAGRQAMLSRASLGAKLHRKLEHATNVRYDAEVSMTNTTVLDGISYEVSGRADGILYTDPFTVDEIKTVGEKAFSALPSPMHEAQVKCYAYFLCREKGLEQVQTRLTYYCVEDGKLRHVTKTHTVGELQAFYLALLSRIAFRAKMLIERRLQALPSAAGVHFPYASVRQGQDIMIRECYRDIRAGKRLFVEAPTGTGKTLSALYPAVRALGEGHIDRIFYLTAKTATGREAYRAAAQLFEAGAKLRTVILTAREHACRNEAAKQDTAAISRHCNPKDCPYAKGFYERCEAAICEALSTSHGFTRTALLELAEKYRICPYEFQLELSWFCDIIICDYNYAFDPAVYLRRYFEPEIAAKNKYVFLIDEAHNLADRAAAMYTAELDSETIASLWRSRPETEEKLRGALEKLTVTMHGFRRICRDTLFRDDAGVEHGFDVSRTPMETTFALIREVRQVAEEWLRAHRGDELETAVYGVCAELKHFETVSEYYDDCFLQFIEIEGDSRRLRLLCLDPSHVLSLRLGRAHATVMFSATLTPSDYFADILGGGKNAVRISLPSPFDPARLCLVALPTVSTRYEDRAKSYKKIASAIAATVSGRKGNYLVFFPSYAYMEKVLEIFSKRYAQVPCVVQKRGMTAAERDAFLGTFCDDGTLRVGFCVLGGSFSEGIDLIGGRLIGTVIVGTGLPAITNERNILRDYYENTRERGYDYAYTYPGMNRVLQAAGRVIRRDEDRGVVVLIDDRFASDRVKPLFPAHWEHLQYAGDTIELAEIVTDFWKNVR